MRTLTHRILAIVALIMAGAMPAAAELRYVMRVEVVKVGEAASPMAAALGKALQGLMPEGAVEAVYLVGPRGMRVESPKAGFGLPSASIALWTPKGDVVVLNEADKTFWRLDLNRIAGAMNVAGISMHATVSPAVKDEPILNVPTEKRTFDVEMQMAMLQNTPEMREHAGALLKGMKISGEVWTAAGRYQQYADVISKSAFARALQTFGLGEFTRQVIMRQTMRMAGYEMRAEVTNITEQQVPASLFEIPADYKEIEPPRR